MSIKTIEYASERTLKIIDGEYVIGARSACKNEIQCPKKIVNGYVIRECGGENCYEDYFQVKYTDFYYDVATYTDFYLNECFCKYQDLKKFYIMNCHLHLPDCFFLLSQINILKLENCYLKEMDERILNFKDLIILSWSANHLNVVPSWIGDLKGLERLYLQRNNLTSLPNEISNLDDEDFKIYLYDNDFNDDEKDRIENELLPNSNVYWE